MNTLKKTVAGLALVAAGYAPVAGAQWTFDTAVPGSATTTSTMGVTFVDILDGDGVRLNFFASGLTATQRVWNVYFNVPTGVTLDSLNVYALPSSEAGTAVAFTVPSNTSAGTFDVGLTFPVADGPKNNRFMLGEHVYVDVLGATAASFNSWAGVATNGYFGVAQLNNGIMAAVPEPETYAMLLAGLALMGWMARRRKQSLQPYPV